MFKILVNKNLSRDATDFYLKVIKESLQLVNEECIFVKDIKNIDKNDTVITVDAKDFLKVLLYKKNSNIINWFQGIVPEEAFLVKKSWIRKIYWELFEWIALRKSMLNIFVSESMKEHYKKKYRYYDENYVVIPCFNRQINRISFEENQKYKTMKFVYAGSLAKWQCFDYTINCYKKIEETFPNAEFYVLTNEIESAKIKVSQSGIKNFYIYNVPYEEIDYELEKFKYGFLIREDILVNNVSTPTKMSTYMANGIIPIYSEVIGDFEKQFKEMKYVIRHGTNDLVEELVKKIIKFEKMEIPLEEIYEDYNNIFLGYYNSEKYKKDFILKLFPQGKTRKN